MSSLTPFLRSRYTGQRGFRDLQRSANVLYWVSFLVEILGNTALFATEDGWSATFAPSGPGCYKASICSFSDQVSLKLRKRAKDMKNKLAPA
jgi:hypothetical protein